MNKQSKIDPAISSAFIAKAIKWPVGHHYHSMEISPLSTMASDAGMCLLLVDGTCGARAQLRTYYVKITMGSGVTNFICDNLGAEVLL